jgi:hypothetical protein
MSGYRHCACLDCFQIAIGERGALCEACEIADCDPEQECQAEGAYGTLEDRLEIALLDQTPQSAAQHMRDVELTEKRK